MDDKKRFLVFKKDKQSVTNVGRLLQICLNVLEMEQLSLQTQNMTQTKRKTWIPMEASSIDWTTQSRFHLMMREEPSLETLWLKNIRTMHKVQISDPNYTAPSSKTFRDEKLDSFKIEQTHFVSSLSKTKTLESLEESPLSTKTLSQVKYPKEKFKKVKGKKVPILTVLPKNWSIRKIQQEFKASNYMVWTSNKLLAEKGILSSHNVKSGKVLPRVCLPAWSLQQLNR
jgi:hypothetical protein